MYRKKFQKNNEHPESDESSKKVVAKKSFGQNFLKSEKALDSIIEAGDIREGDLVLEIGPGQGALTDKLLSKKATILAIEKDNDLCILLNEKYQKEILEKQILILNADILNIDYETIIASFKKIARAEQSLEYKLIANIPYYITGQIIRNFLSLDYQPILAVLLVQKEVAERIISNPGKIGSDKNPKYKENLLSISVKAYSEPVYIQTVKAGSFDPSPKVDSAIILLKRINRDSFENINEQFFFQIVKAGFRHKRKNLIKNLKSIQENSPEINSAIEKISSNPKYLENPKIRAEDLSLEDWLSILKR